MILIIPDPISNVTSFFYEYEKNCKKKLYLINLIKVQLFH